MPFNSSYMSDRKIRILQDMLSAATEPIVYNPSTQSQSAYNQPPINPFVHESFVPTLNDYRVRNVVPWQAQYAATESSVPTYRTERQSPYNRPPNNTSTDESFTYYRSSNESDVPIPRTQSQAAYNPPPINPSARDSFQPTLNRFTGSYAGNQRVLSTAAQSVSARRTQRQSAYNRPPINLSAQDSLDPTPNCFTGSFAGYIRALHNRTKNFVPYPRTQSQSATRSPLISPSSYQPFLPHDIEENEHKSVRSNYSIKEDGIAAYGNSKMNEAISVLGENLKDSYLNKMHTDVTIKVINKEFSAHKFILCARSQVFAAMFNYDSSEKRSGIIEITDCDPDSFEDFLLFLYTADLKIVSSKNVVCLYKTSDKYGIKELFQECVQCMIQELSADTFCDYYQVAILHNEYDLLTAAKTFFNTNANTILPTINWLSLIEEHPSLCNELLINFFSSKSGIQL